MFMNENNSNPLAGFAAGIGSGLVEAGVSQAFSQYNARQDYNRQKKLMNKQFMLNQAAQKNAALNTVEGMRMAGLNPALAQGQVQTGSSQGLGASSMAKAPDMKIDPLSVASINSMNAQAKKDNADAGAQERVNNAWDDENAALPGYMRVQAEKWQNSKWYNNLGEDTKNTIDAIAAGDEGITIGKFNALQKAIAGQKDLSDADRAVAENAFQVGKMASQFNDPNIWNAMIKEPLAKYNLTEKQIEGIDQQMKESAQKILNMVQDITESKERIAKYKSDVRLNDASIKEIQTKTKAIIENDIGLLVKDGRYGKALAKKMDEYAQTALSGFMNLLGAYILKRGMQNMGKGDDYVPIGDRHGNYPSQERADKVFYREGLGDWTNHNLKGGDGFTPYRSYNESYDIGDGIQQMRKHK